MLLIKILRILATSKCIKQLLYITSKTRLDIACAVSIVARFCANPTTVHWTAVKRILRHLQGTQNFGLLYKSDTTTEIEGYSDADWAGDVTDRKSMSGFVFLLGGAAVSWRVVLLCPQQNQSILPCVLLHRKLFGIKI